MDTLTFRPLTPDGMCDERMRASDPEPDHRIRSILKLTAHSSAASNRAQRVISSRSLMNIHGVLLISWLSFQLEGIDLAPP